MKILFNQRQKEETPEPVPVQVDPRIFEDTDESDEEDIFEDAIELCPPQVTYSKTGETAVKQLLCILEKEYNIKLTKYSDPKNGYEKKDAFYIVSNKENSRRKIVVENQSYHHTIEGLITTHIDGKKSMYSREAEEMMSTWDSFRLIVNLSSIRKQYDYRGKNIDEVLQMVHTILS